MLLFVCLSVTVVSLLFLLCIVHVRKKYSFWKTLGVPYVPARFPLGNIQHASHLMLDLYQELKGKHRFGGIFQFTEPVAMIIDPELIKHVLVRDVRHFYDRGGYANLEHDSLSGHMLNSASERWTVLRRATSPIFSSGRLKAFFSELVQTLARFREHLDEKIAAQGEKLDVKYMLAQQNTDLALRFVVGVEGNSLGAPDDEIHEAMARGVFLIPSVWQLFLMTAYRSVARRSRLKLFSQELTDVMQRLVRDTISRKKNVPQLEASRRIDLVDQLLKQPGFNGNSSLTLAELTAEVFLFCAAFEATATTIFYCLYELAERPELQQRARACINESIVRHGGVTYEGITEMPYLDQCINETLRKYPPAINLIRTVTEAYPVPDSPGIVLPKGLNIIVPTYAIHHDPEYYPEPERFDPDRFTPEAYKARSPYVFLPFGKGPKQCIGYRQAMIHMRTRLAVLLSSYEFVACPKDARGTQLEGRVVIQPKGDLSLWVKKLHRNDLFPHGKTM